MGRTIDEILLDEAMREFGIGVTVERDFANESVSVRLNGTGLSAFGPYGEASMAARPEEKRRFARGLVATLRKLLDDNRTIGLPA